MTGCGRSTLAMVLAGVWVTMIFVLYLWQFKPIILSLTDRLFS